MIAMSARTAAFSAAIRPLSARAAAGPARRERPAATVPCAAARPLAQPLVPSQRLASTALGSLVLRLLPGPLYYTPALALPLSALAGGTAALRMPALLAHLASQPVVQAVGPLGGLLQAASASPAVVLAASIAASLAAVWLAFVLVPLLDLVLGRDLRNPPPVGAAAAAAAAADLSYRSVLYAYVPLHLAMVWGLEALLASTPAHPLVFLGCVASAGTAGGIAFSAAHELSHGHARLERGLAALLLAHTCYMHWADSHLAHHVKARAHVATPEDPATARRGEPLWAFIPRSIWGNLVDGYGMEVRRLQARGAPLLSPVNRMVWWAACPLALAAASFALFGALGLTFFLAQAAWVMLNLELVNYIEHYGIVRAKRPDGRYERIGPEHSWNVNTLATSAIAFRLQRHSDHHDDASKPFHLLRDVAEAPQLPACYPCMMMLAIVPPLWFAVMDPRVDALQQRRQQRGESAADAAAGAPAA
eukprot:scaffold3.g6723.t1